MNTDRMNAREVAAYMGWEYRKALRMLGNQIPAFFDGYRWTASRADVQAYIDANTVTDRSTKARKRGRGRRAA